MSRLHKFKGLLPPIKPISHTPILHLPQLRSFLLLLLLVYASISILKLASTRPDYSVFESETSEVFGSLKTHISSTKRPLEVHEENKTSSIMTTSPCSSLINGEAQVRKQSNQQGTLRFHPQKKQGILCCDRSHPRTDICYMKGDIRTDSQSSSIILYNPEKSSSTQEELIRPYTRKWETSIMNTVDEIRLKPDNGALGGRRCDVYHVVPGVVFSTGGYTGNVYHEFNDGLLPLYITVGRFGGEVVLVVLEYHKWWMSRYEGIVKKISRYDVVNFRRDKRVHCFKEMIVGLKIHGELTINQANGTSKGIHDFQTLLSEGLLGARRQAEQKQLQANTQRQPKLVILTRNKSRVLLNLREVIQTCKCIGFKVHLLKPNRNTQLADIYSLLNSADAMLGVHGAAMTHFLFMRPGSVFIQIVPLGLNWAAEEYYGEPAKKLGLKYMEYRISTEESSLSEEYDRDDPVLVDPVAVNKKGWSETKRIYLERQNVRVNIERFHRLLEKVYSHVKLHSRKRVPRFLSHLSFGISVAI
ncbi:hypothetical protein AAC387_Pa10g1330 [Persea americana]